MLETPEKSPPTQTSSDAEEKPNSLLSFFLTLVIAVGLALIIQWLVVKPYRIPSESMVPTLQVGQRVLVDRLTMHWRDPAVGRVTVFRPPIGWSDSRCGSLPAPGAPCSRPTSRYSKRDYFIKRIVAGPGDRIRIVAGKVIRNGHRVREPYALPCTSDRCDFPTTIRIPAGHYFMMGDNRDNSGDSRFWGPVAREQIIGEAFLTYWPPSRVGTIHGAPK